MGTKVFTLIKKFKKEYPHIKVEYDVAEEYVRLYNNTIITRFADFVLSKK